MFITRETKLGDSFVTNFPVSIYTVKYTHLYASGSGLIDSEYSSSYIGTFVPHTSSKWDILVKECLGHQFIVDNSTKINLYKLDGTGSTGPSFKYETSSFGKITDWNLTSSIKYIVQLCPTGYLDKFNNTDNGDYVPKFSQHLLRITPTGSLATASTSSISVNTASNVVTVTSPGIDSLSFVYFSASFSPNESTTAWVPSTSITYDRSVNTSSVIYAMTMRDNSYMSALTSASLL